MEKQTYNTNKSALLQAEIPKESRTYKPYTHQQVIDITLESIEKSGFKLESESYTAANGGLIATGKYSIKNVADNEMSLQIAWLNSYNKTKRLTWGVGSVVKICQNGMISADLGAFKKKHMGEINEFAPKTITEYVKRAQDVFKKMQEERELMKEVQIDKTITAHILGELFLNEELVTTTQLNIIKREIEMPSFDYGSDNSLWQLYNHLTLSLKEIHPSLYMKSHMDGHRYFVNKSGILEKGVSLPASDISPNQLSLLENV